jgi:hypothetical protein
MDIIIPDTLVLKIVEYDSDSHKPDTTLYLLYDKGIHRYVIRGQRQETDMNKSCTYSFECESVHDLADFIEFIIDAPNNRVSYILYNYDNLPQTSNEISFEFLKNFDHITYEIAGYDNNNFKRKYLIKHLSMLRNIFNYNN